MKKIFYILLLFCFGYSPVAGQITSDNSLGFSAGIFTLTGDNTDDFETGYSAGLTYEHRFSKNFALELFPFAAYVYGETEVPFFGVYIDNYVFGASVQPKLSVPVGKGKFQFVIGPKLSLSYVYTDVEIWYSDFYSSEGTSIFESNG